MNREAGAAIDDDAREVQAARKNQNAQSQNAHDHVIENAHVIARGHGIGTHVTRAAKNQRRLRLSRTNQWTREANRIKKMRLKLKPKPKYTCDYALYYQHQN